jgi:SMP-30/Gluconolactonase/LRE-like region
VWADLGDGVPDGICIDAENAVWYGDVPNKRCVRVREGGEVCQTIDLDRGCFACMLGGADRKTLFMVAAQWLGFTRIAAGWQAQTGQVLTAAVSVLWQDGHRSRALPQLRRRLSSQHINLGHYSGTHAKQANRRGPRQIQSAASLVVSVNPLVYASEGLRGTLVPSSFFVAGRVGSTDIL